MSQGENASKDLLNLINDKIFEGNKKIQELYSSPHIYRVPEDLRKLNKNAYTPRLIAIGPLHRGDKHLQTHMQDIKMQYTYSLISRTAKDTETISKKSQKMGDTLNICVAEMEKRAKKAREYYPEEVPVVDKNFRITQTKVAKAKKADEEKKANEEMGKKAEQKKAEQKKAEEEMAEMMLVDGCFILELLYSSYHKKHNKESGDGGNWQASGSSPQPTNGGEHGSKCSSLNGEFVDPIRDSILTENIVKHDLLLLENQIPFFVLEDLFHRTVEQIPEDPIEQILEDPIKRSKPSLTDYVWDYFHNIMSPYEDNSEDENSKNKTCSPRDCVILVNKMDSYCFRKETESENKSGKGDQPYHHILHFLHHHILHFLHHCYSPGGKLPTGICPTSPWLCWQSSPPVGEPPKFTELEILATDLDYAGVKFVPVKGKNLFDIKFRPPKCLFWLFRRARFEIPTLDIHDPTEPFLRNLIAMEQCCPRVGRYFTCYAKFFDKLINSMEDVKVLTKARVIRNHLGADKDVSDLFNKLCKEIVIPGDDFIFNNQCQSAYEYSQRLWPKSMAQLRRNYFEVPWSSIGFCAALIVFGITVTNFIREFLK